MIEIQSRAGVSLIYVYDFIRNELKGHYEMQVPYGESGFGRCEISSAAITTDSKTGIFGCADGSILAANLLDGVTLTRWQAFNEPITAIAISADGAILAAGNASGFIRLWDVKK